MSTAIGYSSLGAGVFTDKMLDDNFMVIAEYTQKLEPLIATLSRQVLRHDEALAKLTRKKGRMLPILVGAGIGIYVYKRSKSFAKKIDIVFENANKPADKEYAETVPKDVDAS